MASSRNYVRDYRQERLSENPKRKAERASRNRARRALAKRVGLRELLGKDVDHITPLDKGGSDAMSNLRPRNKHANRSFKRTRTGGVA